MASAAEQLAANMNFGAFHKATELHKRIWFTLMALMVYRIGTYIPIPGIDTVVFARLRPGSRRASWACSTCSRAAPSSGWPSSR